MNPVQRRILQAVLYESIGVAIIGPALSVIFDQEVISTILLSVIVSGIALVWSYIFNSIFELWESRQHTKGRSVTRRLVHGIGFEGGLALILVPLTAWWLDLTLLNALFVEAGILVFFFFYAVAFNWIFDHIFGLPLSAKDASNIPIKKG